MKGSKNIIAINKDAGGSDLLGRRPGNRGRRPQGDAGAHRGPPEPLIHDNTTGAAPCSSRGPSAFPRTDSRMPEIWRNWAGNQRALVELVRPTTEHELCSIVQRAADEGRRVKAVGAGHSLQRHGADRWRPAIARGLRPGPVTWTSEAGLLTVQAGARLARDLGLPVEQGPRTRELGDIDVSRSPARPRQAPTVRDLHSAELSTGIVGLRIVDGTGAVVECDGYTNPELVAVSPGSAWGHSGSCRRSPCGWCPRSTFTSPRSTAALEEVQEAFDELVAGNDHFEFYGDPPHGTGVHQTRSTQCRAARAPEHPGTFGCEPSRSLPGPRRGQCSTTSGPSGRSTAPVGRRFLEMEYAVPLEATIEALGSVRRLIDGTANPTMFPLVVRTAAGGRHRTLDRVRAQDRIHRVPCRSASTSRAVLPRRGSHPDGPRRDGHTGARCTSAQPRTSAPRYPRWDEFARARGGDGPRGDVRQRLHPPCVRSHPVVVGGVELLGSA